MDSNILVEDCLDLVAEWLPVRDDHFVLTALSQEHSAVLQDPDIAMLCHDVRHDNSGVTWKMFSGRGQDSQWLYSPGHELDDISPVWTSIHSVLDQFSSLQFSPQSLNRYNLVHIQLKPNPTYCKKMSNVDQPSVPVFVHLKKALLEIHCCVWGHFT